MKTEVESRSEIVVPDQRSSGFVPVSKPPMKIDWRVLGTWAVRGLVALAAVGRCGLVAHQSVACAMYSAVARRAARRSVRGCYGQRVHGSRAFGLESECVTGAPVFRTCSITYGQFSGRDVTALLEACRTLSTFCSSPTHPGNR
jgi:hypothetical protein